MSIDTLLDGTSGTRIESIRRSEEKPEWLDVVAQIERPDGWVLYRYEGASRSKQ